MNKRLFVIGILVVLLMVSFSGCGELEEFVEPDYITTTVYCRVQVLMEGNNDFGAVPDALVKVEIIKAGGERVSDLVTTGDWGFANKYVSGTFDVYNEQPIECIANIVLESVSDIADYYTFHSGSITIPYSEIKQAKKSDNTAALEKELKIFGMKNPE
jgi:hypothetical protein